MAILELPAMIVRTVSGSPLEVASERLDVGDVLNYPLAVANTEYPIALPLGTIEAFFNAREGFLTYLTTSGGTELRAGPSATVELKNLDPALVHIFYVKSSKDNDILQVHARA